ncbi:MAG: transcription termination/antitermination protein NusG [Candidatus Binatia bacterium]
MALHLLKTPSQMPTTHSDKNPKDRHWYVVYSKPRREEFAQLHLQRKGLEVFFPRLSLPNPRPRQGQIVPLFPNYLFVCLQLPEEYNYALWSPGVKTIVNFNNTPTPIDEEVINFLKDQADIEGVIKGHSNLTTGQEIRIKGGPFDGLIGIIQDPPNARGRVSILMQLLNRQVKVEVPVYFVENNRALPSRSEES